ncbi:MAG TPA: SCO family protein [Xanthobacteraceae bacterium]|jgi:protein SCO1/2
MKRASRVAIVSLGVCASIAIIALALGLSRPGLPDASLASRDVSSFAFQPNPGARLPLTTSLVDEAGRDVALGSFFTRSPVVLVLEYLRCTSLCGVTLRNLVDALHGLPLEPGRDYQLVAISIDPRDTPADAMSAREKYVELLGRSGGETGMHFLTAASSAGAREIADRIGFPYRYDSLLDAYIHPAGFIIAAPDGVISRYVEGVAVSPRDLIGAFADAEEDKSQGPLARLLLLCHGLSAPLGRFTVPVLTAFTIADIAAALALIAIFAAIRRRRHS